MKTETFSVTGMGCAGCPVRIQKALLEEDGVSEAQVSLEGKSATITYDENAVTPDDLKAVVDDLGYVLILPK